MFSYTQIKPSVDKNRHLTQNTGIFCREGFMDTLDQMRIRAGLRVNELADLADVSESTLRKMIRGDGVSGALIYKVLRVLSERLGREITLDDVRGLTIL
jgi:predicted transcriptional regulator